MAPMRKLCAFAAMSLIAVACGGGGSESAPSTTNPPASAGATTTVASATTAEPAAATGGGESYARVTIGDETYEYAPTGFVTERCDTNFFGGFWVLFTTGVTIMLPADDWEEQGIEDQPMVEAQADDLEWFADAESDPYGYAVGQSQVDSYVIEGNYASGTATFVEREATYKAVGGGPAVEAVTGTFEAYCAG